MFFISFEAFKGLSNITHLTLRFDDNWNENNIKANTLTDIDIFLPKTPIFWILEEISATQEEVPQMADILSRPLTTGNPKTRIQ